MSRRSGSRSLEDQVLEYVSYLKNGETVKAIDAFYAEDACVFENRELARAGRARCVEYERAALAKLSAAPRFRVHGHAVNERSGTAFIEYTIRFSGADGRPFRLDEVAVQTWEHGKIIAERFYYEGLVDEGDEEEPAEGGEAPAPRRP